MTTLEKIAFPDGPDVDAQNITLTMDDGENHHYEVDVPMIGPDVFSSVLLHYGRACRRSNAYHSDATVLMIGWLMEHRKD